VSQRRTCHLPLTANACVCGWLAYTAMRLLSDIDCTVWLAIGWPETLDAMFGSLRMLTWFWYDEGWCEFLGADSRLLMRHRRNFGHDVVLVVHGVVLDWSLGGLVVVSVVHEEFL
jgi:hypothetical protein